MQNREGTKNNQQRLHTENAIRAEIADDLMRLSDDDKERVIRYLCSYFERQCT